MPHLNWKIYGELSYFIKGTKPLNGGIPLKDIDALRDKTNVGDKIKFIADVYKRTEAYGGQSKRITVEGRIKAKYPHIFMLEDGRTYSWVDYMLGKQM